MKGYINNFLSEFIFRIYLPFSYLLKKKKKRKWKISNIFNDWSGTENTFIWLHEINNSYNRGSDKWNAIYKKKRTNLFRYYQKFHFQ